MNSKAINKIEAAVITVFLLGAMFLVPTGALELDQTENSVDTTMHGTASDQEIYENCEDLGPFWLDRTYIIEDPFPASTQSDDNDDAGYKKDAGDEIGRALPIYPGEMIDDWPGRGDTGKINADDHDEEDWYFFSVCDGQDIVITMTPPSGFDFDLGLWDEDKDERATSTNSGSTAESITFTADYTGKWFMRIHYISGSGEGQYSFDVNLVGQNDAGTGDDAGDNFADATSISPGTYEGYLDMNDDEDWYKFYATAGQGIHFNLEMYLPGPAYRSDFDIYLYNPGGELVHSEAYYYGDELLYPADMTGEWRVKVDIFPGYTDIPQPTEWEYFTYGSGPYEFEFSLESSAPDPPGPIPQPEITPIAHTFKITNDPYSNKDAYGYLASIPACNYLENGERYLAPIVYTGDTTATEWFGTVDDTTNYLLDDWNTYLAGKGKTAVEYIVPNDPVEAAAEIATQNWESSDTAVVAIDGSSYEDTTTTVLQKTKTLIRNVNTKSIPNEESNFIEIEGSYLYVLGTLFTTAKWGAISVSIEGPDIPGGYFGVYPSLIELYPKFMKHANDWWPESSDVPRKDIYYPVTTEGVWAASVNELNGDWNLKVKKYQCHRHKIQVNDPDSVLKATVKTSTPSDLLVFLIDPKGHIKAPDIPDWNGGQILDIHEWHGIDDPDYPPSCDDWRIWEPEDHTEFSAEVLHPYKGEWTAIVVPRYAQGALTNTYTITVEVTKINQKRSAAAVSAANAAVIASLEHVPLLYVKEDSVPTATQNAFNTLGVNKVIFVEDDKIGDNVRSQLPTLEADLQNMQEIIDYIKDYPASENYITITSLKTGDGYFAPSAMLAAYHGSPVLRIGETAGGAGTGGTSVNKNKLVIAGQINQNVYCINAQTGEVIWSNPTGWVPVDSSPTGSTEGKIYLGSTSDIIFCMDAEESGILWSHPANSVDSSFDGIEGSFYLDVEESESGSILYYLDSEAINGELQSIPLPPVPLPRGGGAGPACVANRIDTWRLWGGDYYHGNRAPGHLPIHTEPVPQIGTDQLLIELTKYLLSGGEQGNLPPLGMDAKRYWNEEMHDGVHDWIKDYGLDLAGQEAYVFVAPRKDLRLELHSVMIGNNSYAGQIPGKTPAYTNDIIIRNVLYPALIYANPNCDVTTTQFMNYPDCGQWTTNDGTRHQQICSSRVVKNAFMSHGRTYDGHCLWDAHLERLNDGASVFYYSGHGTGGSGISAQYKQTDYCDYPDVEWYDSWRGYMYDDWKTPRDHGRRWYNPEPPNLYDIIHYKWNDQLLQNLRSLAVFYMSCSTAQQFGPLVYLDHGSVLWYGNAGSGVCPEADLMDDWFFEDSMIHGEPVGAAYSKYVWLHYRDFTTSDPTAMYGPSSIHPDLAEGITTVHCIYGDPNLIIYSPDWNSPVPVDSPLGSPPPILQGLSGDLSMEGAQQSGGQQSSQQQSGSQQSSGSSSSSGQSNIR